MTHKFIFSSDPGHGWLLVTLEELQDIGLSEADITPYSYRHPESNILALEEDCDAATFLERWKKHHPDATPTFDEKHSDPNPIRDWPRFGTKELVW